MQKHLFPLLHLNVLKSQRFLAVLNASLGVMNALQKTSLYAATALTMFSQGCKNNDPTPKPVDPVAKIDTIYNNDDIYVTLVKAQFSTSKTADPANPLGFILTTKEAGVIYGDREIDKDPGDVLVPMGSGSNFNLITPKNVVKVAL